VPSQVFFEKSVIAIWSVPAYEGHCANVAGVLDIDEHGAQSFHTFSKPPANERTREYGTQVPRSLHCKTDLDPYYDVTSLTLS
jgi:hypothetical protein